MYFLTQNSHSGRSGLGFGHWIYPVISPGVKSTWAELLHFIPFSAVTMECFCFHWRLGRLKYFQLASKLFIKEQIWFENLMAAPDWNNSLRREQSSILKRAAQGTLCNPAQNKDRGTAFLGRGILQAPKASPPPQKCPQALTLISSTLSLSGTLAAPSTNSWV